MRYRATVAYDGTAYLGYQRQAVGDTVQGEIEKVLSKLNRNRPVTVYGSGRTDKGVHAHGQEIAFDLEWRHDIPTLMRALNATLPNDIAIANITEAAANFHPRFEARRRSYRYRVYNEPLRAPHLFRYTWQIARKLDIDAMNIAAQSLVGEHDFETFGRSPTPGGHTVRRVFLAKWSKIDEIVAFDIQGNAFLYRMVRNLVGSLVQVGLGNWSPDEIEKRLAQKNSDLCAVPAPPQGLSLIRVEFEE